MDAEKIAAGMSEAQAVLLGKLPQRRSLINGAPGRALYRKGLATLAREDGRLIPTKLGAAVREVLSRGEG